jgi:SAM-dependent methyltransferase
MNRDEYRKMAEAEDSMWRYSSLHRHVGRELSNVLGRVPAKILDAGCGTGGLIRRMMSQVPAWEWTGLDALPLACQLASERSGAAIVEGRVEALPFADEEFDAVVSTDVLCNVKNDQAALRESFRVLRPGGVMFVNVPAYQWLWSYHDVATHAERRYQSKELANKIRAAGFGETSTTHWNALTLPLIAFRRKVLPASPGESDVRPYPVLINKTLDAFMKVEHAWIGLGGRWSFGSSEIAVARKPKNGEQSEVLLGAHRNGQNSE